MRSPFKIGHKRQGNKKTNNKTNAMILDGGNFKATNGKRGSRHQFMQPKHCDGE